MISGLGNTFHKRQSRPQQLPGYFMWLRADYGITLNYISQTGTVATTNGDTTVTLTGSTFTDFHVGAQIKTGTDVRTIMSKTSSTEVEVDLPYTATASGLTYSFGFVSNWTDMISSGYFASQGTAANQGLWRAFAANGNPAIYFNGGTQEMQTNFLDDNTKMTVYAVVKDDSTALPAGVRFIMKMTGGVENHQMTLGLGTLGSVTTGATQGTVTFAGAGQNLMIAGFSSGFSKHLGFNNRSIGSSVYSGNGVFNTPTTFIVGGGETNRRFHGHIAEVIMYKEAHPVPMILQNIGQLAARYGLRI